jgi:hypothetical protein
MRQVLLGLLTASMLLGFWLILARLDKAALRRLWLVAFVIVLMGGVTMMVSHSFVARWGIRTDSPRDGLWAMMAGTAERPFVFRRLAPDAISLATDVAERLPSRAVDAYLDKSTLLELYAGQDLSRRERIGVHAAYAFVWLMWFGASVAGAALLQSLRACSWFEALMTSTLGICLMPLTFGNGGYVYDPTELLLWTALALCASRGWFVAMVPLFAALIMNKESSFVVLPALYPLLARRLRPKVAAASLAAVGCVGVAWLWFVRMKYADRPGATQLLFIAQNLRFWSRPASFWKVSALYSPGLFAPGGGNLAILALLGIPMSFGWRHVASEVRRGTAVIAAIIIPLFLVSGLKDETRVLEPLFPFLLVVCAEGLARMYRAAPASA